MCFIFYFKIWEDGWYIVVGIDFGERGIFIYRGGKSEFFLEGNLLMFVKIIIICSFWFSILINLFYIVCDICV